MHHFIGKVYIFVTTCLHYASLHFYRRIQLYPRPFRNLKLECWTKHIAIISSNSIMWSYHICKDYLLWQCKKCQSLNVLLQFVLHLYLLLAISLQWANLDPEIWSFVISNRNLGVEAKTFTILIHLLLKLNFLLTSGLLTISSNRVMKSVLFPKNLYLDPSSTIRKWVWSPFKGTLPSPARTSTFAL